MEQTLRQFVNGNLFEATHQLLRHLHIQHTQEEPTPMRFEDYYESVIPQYMRQALALTRELYYIGEVCDDAIQGNEGDDTSLHEDLEKLRANARYKSMMLFAVDLKPEVNITRTDLAVLTRAFNRLVYNFPVSVIFRQGHWLSIATCERTEYKQEWRQGQGEKLGKVSLLRNIECLKPHRGHLDILESIGDKVYSSFDELYKHWMEVFSSELLTRKFYSELSDWYAWAVQVARFPNNITTTTDDEKFNHESCIRLITRLIFVWFMKQKHLIPNEFFDEQYIKDHFIEEFNPHDRANLLYNPEKSRYYRLILQNLFFAMLNRPIVPEGQDTPNNRQFRGDHQFGFKRDGYNVNNLMRYKNEFRAGGAEEFLTIANSHVPFLNGGLFDCMDDKPKNLYYDGFSERKESLEQLYLPDWLFFGDEVGRSIDLSKWYGDAKKKKVSARGIIDILKRYNFTIEENTPLDQEVSLDPELLGKAFENLLASYNPETQTSARKQTGSFYTPREIVQYMVDESLVAHLKRTCGEELETEYRKLLSYATEETSLDEEQRRSIMQAIYHCRVLDPACGSGAFPMGVLQQMVHILRQLDPTNEMWKDFMIDIAIDQSRQAFNAEEEEERKALLADIEEAFNRHVNDPDYARKLYLIEHCIYGVDIQPIAVQISKLRFFISLVVDQKPTDDATHNFGIRPLPNLESKFVAANTLIPVKYDASLVESSDEVMTYKDHLKELNHKIFLAKRNVDKQRLKDEIKETRRALAQAIINTGFVSRGAAQQLADWDMFDQNTSAPFFDAEWMFGVKGGFDIVIANPPYIRKTKIPLIDKIKYEGIYDSAIKQYDMYLLFIERGLSLLEKGKGYLCYINPLRFFNADYGIGCRRIISTGNTIETILDVSQLSVFKTAMTYPCIMLLREGKPNLIHSFTFMRAASVRDIMNNRMATSISIDQSNISKDRYYRFLIGKKEDYIINSKICRLSKSVSQYYDIARGLPNNVVDFDYPAYDAIKSTNVKKYSIVGDYIEVDSDEAYIFKNEMIVMPRTVLYLQASIKPKRIVVLDRIYYFMPKTRTDDYLSLGLINSKLINYWFEFNYWTSKVSGNYFDLNGDQIGSIPLIIGNNNIQKKLSSLVRQVLDKKRNTPNTDTFALESEIDNLVYHLYGLTYDEVLIIDPNPPFTQEEYEQVASQLTLH